MNRINAFTVFTAVAFVLLANLSTGYGFRCYLCNTEHDSNCGDHFNNTSHIRHENCGNAYEADTRYVCRKVKYHQRNNEIAISRSCVAEGEGEQNPCAPNQLAQYLKVEHCSTCTTDLCNSAPAVFAATSLVGPVLVLFSKLNLL